MRVLIVAITTLFSDSSELFILLRSKRLKIALKMDSIWVVSEVDSNRSRRLLDSPGAGSHGERGRKGGAAASEGSGECTPARPMATVRTAARQNVIDAQPPEVRRAPHPALQASPPEALPPCVLAGDRTHGLGQGRVEATRNVEFIHGIHGFSTRSSRCSSSSSSSRGKRREVSIAG